MDQETARTLLQEAVEIGPPRKAACKPPRGRRRRACLFAALALEQMHESGGELDVLDAARDLARGIREHLECVLCHNGLIGERLGRVLVLGGLLIESG